MSLFWIFLYLTDKIETASKAAFIAPAFPMANVPTGTPLGIWTVDNKLSKPLSLLSIGIPNTGSVVNDAVTPAKWAAPPAPAIKISVFFFFRMVFRNYF